MWALQLWALASPGSQGFSVACSSTGAGAHRMLAYRSGLPELPVEVLTQPNQIWEQRSFTNTAAIKRAKKFSSLRRWDSNLGQQIFGVAVPLEGHKHRRGF
jgi:hypothetical protein